MGTGDLKNSRGSILPVAFFLAMASLAVTFVFVDLMAGMTAAQRAQTAADFALLSAMRVKSQSLETIATRWEVFGTTISVVGGVLEAPAGMLPAIAAGANALRRALPGFQGRITSALTVAAEANGLSRVDVTSSATAGLRLGLESERALIRAAGFPVMDIDGLWFRRTWSERTGPPMAAIEARGRTPVAGEEREFAVSSTARTAWDANVRDPLVSLDGNGGFAQDWTSASAEIEFRPHRHPVFRGESSTEAP